jgi:hypothetical protein
LVKITLHAKVDELLNLERKRQVCVSWTSSARIYAGFETPKQQNVERFGFEKIFKIQRTYSNVKALVFL